MTDGLLGKNGYFGVVGGIPNSRGRKAQEHETVRSFDALHGITDTRFTFHLDQPIKLGNIGIMVFKITEQGAQRTGSMRDVN